MRDGAGARVEAHGAARERAWLAVGSRRSKRLEATSPLLLRAARVRSHPMPSRASEFGFLTRRAARDVQCKRLHQPLERGGVPKRHATEGPQLSPKERRCAIETISRSAGDLEERR
jgi:hypothetical protein